MSPSVSHSPIAHKIVLGRLSKTKLSFCNLRSKARPCTWIQSAAVRPDRDRNKPLQDARLDGEYSSIRPTMMANRVFDVSEAVQNLLT